MSNRASAKQIAYIKTLGRQLDMRVDGDADDGNHVLSVSTFGRVGHWASLSFIEATQAIERLKREVDTYGVVKSA